MPFAHILRPLASQAALQRSCINPQISSTLRRRYARATIVVPKQRSVLLAAPTKAELQEAELEVDLDLAEKDEACVTITDRAAEHLQKISTREENPDLALRVAVESGGCHGYQYRIELTSGRDTEDYRFAHPNTQPSNVVVDAVSLDLLNGATIDYATELIGSNFRITDNPQAKGSGCGCGVSWEAKI